MASLRQEKITVSKSIGLKSRISKVADELRTKTEKLGKCKTRLVKYSQQEDGYEFTYEVITEAT
jgi:hypothetical protein